MHNKNSTVKTSDSGLPRESFSPPGQIFPKKSRPFPAIFVCQLTPEVIHVVRGSRCGAELEIQYNQVTDRREIAGLAKRGDRRCPVVGLLDKTQYLCRILEIPRAQPREVETMLQLEVEAGLPPDYGPVEISYLPLPAEKEGTQRYQIHICRREILSQYWQRLTQLGLKVDFFLPSAITWQAIWDLAAGELDLCVAQLGDQHFETAEKGRNGTPLTIRTIHTPGISQESQRLEQGLFDTVRPLLTQTEPAALPLRIGWIGEQCPHHLSNGRLAFQQIPDLPPQTRLTAAGGKNAPPYLALTAAALLALRHPALLQTSNLLPREFTRQRQQRSLYRRFGWACAAFLTGLVLLSAALKIAIHRYEHLSRTLVEQVAQIQTGGEAIGRRIQQLQVIRTARATQDDFTQVLQGLCTATPATMTYSSVVLTETGQLHLRGQADSLALPFLAPQQLEEQPMFEQVLLKDAGQAQREAGAITEFRIDCTLQRGGIGK